VWRKIIHNSNIIIQPT